MLRSKENNMVVIYDDGKLVIEANIDRVHLIDMCTGEIRSEESGTKYQSDHPEAKRLNKLYAMRRLINKAIERIKREYVEGKEKEKLVSLVKHLEQKHIDLFIKMYGTRCENKDIYHVIDKMTSFQIIVALRQVRNTLAGIGKGE